ncbi:MAG: hypothetical protein EZS28_038773, partial [Streblomastix strix]
MSIECLDSIHSQGDEQVQVELVTNGYPRVLVMDINTAGGNEQEQDREIWEGLYNIIRFIREFLEGRQINPYYPCTSFPPQPDLFKSCLEQFEDEGGNEEIEAQLVNKAIGEYDDIHNNSNLAKRRILNIFIDIIISDYSGRKDDSTYLHVAKGDIAQLFKKELNWYTVEKCDKIGKVPKGLLRAQIPSSSKVNQTPENSELINTPVLPRVIAKQDNANAA